MARIINLLVHYDKGNDDYLFYQLQTTHRFIVQKKLLTRLESLILRTLKKLVMKKPPAAQVKEEFLRLREQLQLLQDEHARKMLTYFDLIAWVDSKIQACDFGELMRARSGNAAIVTLKKDKLSPKTSR